MKTKTFKVTYASGLVETEVVDAGECPDIAAYCNRKFGMAPELVAAHGTVVEAELTEKEAAAQAAAQQQAAADHAAAEAAAKAAADQNPPQ